MFMHEIWYASLTKVKKRLKHTRGYNWTLFNQTRNKMSYKKKKLKINTLIFCFFFFWMLATFWPKSQMRVQSREAGDDKTFASERSGSYRFTMSQHAEHPMLPTNGKSRDVGKTRRCIWIATWPVLFCPVPPPVCCDQMRRVTMNVILGLCWFCRDSLLVRAPDYLFKRLRVRNLAGAAGEFSFPGLTFCADSYSMSAPPPCYRSGT